MTTYSNRRADGMLPMLAKPAKLHRRPLLHEIIKPLNEKFVKTRLLRSAWTEAGCFAPQSSPKPTLDSVGQSSTSIDIKEMINDIPRESVSKCNELQRLVSDIRYQEKEPEIPTVDKYVERPQPKAVNQRTDDQTGSKRYHNRTYYYPQVYQHTIPKTQTTQSSREVDKLFIKGMSTGTSASPKFLFNPQINRNASYQEWQGKAWHGISPLTRSYVDIRQHEDSRPTPSQNISQCQDRTERRFADLASGDQTHDVDIINGLRHLLKKATVPDGKDHLLDDRRLSIINCQQSKLFTFPDKLKDTGDGTLQNNLTATASLKQSHIVSERRQNKLGLHDQRNGEDLDMNLPHLSKDFTLPGVYACDGNVVHENNENISSSQESKDSNSHADVGTEYMELPDKNHAARLHQNRTHISFSLGDNETSVNEIENVSCLENDANTTDKSEYDCTDTQKLKQTRDGSFLVEEKKQCHQISEKLPSAEKSRIQSITSSGNTPPLIKRSPPCDRKPDESHMKNCKQNRDRCTSHFHTPFESAFGLWDHVDGELPPHNNKMADEYFSSHREQQSILKSQKVSSDFTKKKETTPKATKGQLQPKLSRRRMTQFSKTTASHIIKKNQAERNGRSNSRPAITTKLPTNLPKYRDKSSENESRNRSYQIENCLPLTKDARGYKNKGQFSWYQGISVSHIPSKVDTNQQVNENQQRTTETSRWPDHGPITSRGEAMPDEKVERILDWLHDVHKARAPKPKKPRGFY